MGEASIRSGLFTGKDTTPLPPPLVTLLKVTSITVSVPVLSAGLSVTLPLPLDQTLGPLNNAVSYTPLFHTARSPVSSPPRARFPSQPTLPARLGSQRMLASDSSSAPSV